jgi:hypothetical protein
MPAIKIQVFIAISIPNAAVLSFYNFYVIEGIYVE